MVNLFLDFQSVIRVCSGTRTNSQSEQYDSIEIEMDDVGADKLAEIHSKYHVDTVQRKLLRR
jgi:hypothetical protein